MGADDGGRRECPPQPLQAGDAETFDEAAEPVGDLAPLRVADVCSLVKQPPQRRRALAQVETRARVGLAKERAPIVEGVFDPHLAVLFAGESVAQRDLSSLVLSSDGGI